MQRNEDGGIMISCDFCGTDWDEVRPMIEGHQGSVICLDCLRLALDQAQPSETDFDCTLCLRHRDAGVREWSHPNPPSVPGRNPQAAACWDCIRLAAKTFHKEKDVDFRWDPSMYPPGTG